MPQAREVQIPVFHPLSSVPPLSAPHLPEKPHFLCYTFHYWQAEHHLLRQHYLQTAALSSHSASALRTPQTAPHKMSHAPPRPLW